MSSRRPPPKAVLASPAVPNASRLAGALDIGMTTGSKTTLQFYKPVMSAAEHKLTFTNFKTRLMLSFDESKVGIANLVGLEFRANAENRVYSFKLGYQVSFIDSYSDTRKQIKPHTHYVLKLFAVDYYDEIMLKEIAQITFGEGQSTGDVREKLRTKLSEMEQDGGFTADTWTAHFGDATDKGLLYIKPSTSVRTIE